VKHSPCEIKLNKACMGYATLACLNLHFLALKAASDKTPTQTFISIFSAALQLCLSESGLFRTQGGIRQAGF